MITLVESQNENSIHSDRSNNKEIKIEPYKPWSITFYENICVIKK